MDDEKDQKPGLFWGLDRLRDWLADRLKPSPKSDQDIINSVNEAFEEDLISSSVKDTIERLLEGAGFHARDVMVQLGDMKTVRLHHDLVQILQLVTDTGHSRFPVLSDDGDEVVGILLAKDILGYFRKNGDNGSGARDFDLQGIIRKEVLHVPDSMVLEKLLGLFREKRMHMAIVLDEFSQIAGLVTIEDVLEEIVGEIEDELDQANGEDQVREVGANEYEVDARTELRRINKLFNINIDDDVDTIGGLAVLLARKVPSAGEEYHHDLLTLKVTDADERRVKQLRIVPKSAA